MKKRTPPGPPSLEYVERFLERKGFPKSSGTLWRRKYNDLRNNAIERGRMCYLSFGQYMSLAVEAGLRKPSDIGRAKGKFQMSRVGDRGDYIKGNCRFLTVEENQQEKVDSGITKIGAFKRSKPFVAVSPTGKKYKSRNLVLFAKKHDLHRQSMCRVFLGERPHHKGWTGKYTDNQKEYSQ